MTLEEQLKSCQVCTKRKFNPETGIVCGLTGGKPSFDDNCPDFDEDKEAVEDVAKRKAEAEKPAEISGLFAFFLYFSIPVGIIATVISFVTTLKTADYSGSVCLKAFDVVYLLFYVYFAVYTLYAFIKRKPDAVFFGKYLLIVLFASNLLVLIAGGADDNSVMNSVGRVVGSLIWSVIFFVFLSTSQDVEDRIPKKTRKVKGLNKVLFILSIVLPILLYIGGIAELIGKNGGFASAGAQVEQACELKKNELPSYVGDGISWTDMRVEGKQLLFEYLYEVADKDGIDPLALEMIPILSKQKIMLMLPNLAKQDALFPLLVKAGYDATWRYKDINGDFLYSFTVPSETIAAGLKPDYSYETPRETFDMLFNIYRKGLPYELFEECTVRGISLSEDGKTMHYDLLLNNADNSVLTNLTPSYLKDYMTEVLPIMQDDGPLEIAELNGKAISFDFHADGNPLWKMSAKFSPKDYEYLLGDQTLEDEDFQ